MKKIVSILLVCMLVLGTVPALAAAKYMPKYTLKTKGYTVLQDVADREITPKDGVLDVNPVIEGESSVTGLPLTNEDRYMPMLVQISNPINKKGKPAVAGVSWRAPWGGKNADIVYEALLYRTGETRMTYLFSDAFSEGIEVHAGPVRSARYGHVKLREEWQGGLVHVGGPDIRTKDPETTNSIFLLYEQLGVKDKGVIFNAHDNAYADYFTSAKFEGRSKDSTEDNRDANVSALRNLVPANVVAEKHPFLFADVSPYMDGYEQAYTINIDFGHKKYISGFEYSEMDNLYLRNCSGEPYMTFSDSDRYADSKEQMSFSNVIIQRITYFYAGRYDHTQMNSVGKGNADIFIGGRYIPGYWVRESLESPTVFLDDQGNEIQLARGKTYIGQLPPDGLLAYKGAN